MTFFSKNTTDWAVSEWETFAEDLQEGILDQYEYWQDLSMRESFDNGERTLTPELRDRVNAADEIVRNKLIPMLKKYKRLNEYQNNGKKIPQQLWWWHLGEKK
ncbi:MAG: hypothetical protein KBG83_07620 [Bacteroidetes bacterium]|jgi:hypothetical protein|nr:hypothetical protein [Bacteroidota bacterium]HOV99800.1 hypothetical protein [Bacteroidota bacterium]